MPSFSFMLLAVFSIQIQVVSLVASQEHFRLDFQEHSGGLSQLYWNLGLLIIFKLLSWNCFISLLAPFILKKKSKPAKPDTVIANLPKNLTQHSMVVLSDSEDLHTILTKQF